MKDAGVERPRWQTPVRLIKAYPTLNPSRLVCWLVEVGAYILAVV
jgi:hypothetical protein